MERLKGRPNQGKTDTIRERCVNVYLPTKEMLHQWKKDAEKVGMPVSRFVCEIVERHRRDDAENLTPNYRLMERTKELEVELTSLQTKYDILNLAFKRREDEVRNLSDALGKTPTNQIDIGVARQMINILRGKVGVSHSVYEMMGITSLEETDEEQIAKVREALTFFCEIDLIEPSGIDGWKWKSGNNRPKLSPETKNARSRARAKGASKHLHARRVQGGLPKAGDD